ncbi:hypothetical protein Bca52824_079995 [Brassica carinata]|uniref:Uncharacterized protein n=1 Tax=Brassica carinata TaxID=52824 RepID=A0A8X7U1A1_BRACI|nr:hypothetical protein Bca52824_079995 [Brassica carinata]
MALSLSLVENVAKRWPLKAIGGPMRRTVESFGIVHVDQILSTRGLLRTTSSPLDMDILLTRLILLMLRRIRNVSPRSDGRC